MTLQTTCSMRGRISIRQISSTRKTRESEQRPLSLLVVNLYGPADAWYRVHFTLRQLLKIGLSIWGSPSEPFYSAGSPRKFARPAVASAAECLSFSLRLRFVVSYYICKYEDISITKKVMHFLKGLVTDIKQEVKLRQFRTTTDSISFVSRYNKTNSVTYNRP